MPKTRIVKSHIGTWRTDRNVTTMFRRTYHSVAYGQVWQTINVHQDGPMFWTEFKSENPHDKQLSSPYFTSREQAEAQARAYRDHFN